MATIPFQNFALTDPVAAQQAVQMAQILQAAQAEKDRNMGLFARGVQQQQTARENAAEQRALTQSQMAQQSSELEKNRQARAAETDKLIAAQTGTSKVRAELDKEAEAYDNLAARIESEDPPTDSEFNALASNISAERIGRLKDALASKRRTLDSLAQEAKQLADYWNRRFDDVKDGEDHKLKLLKEEYSKDRRANDLLSRDPTKPFRLLPKYKGPRMDPAPVTPIQDLLDPGFKTRMPIGTIPIVPRSSTGVAVNSVPNSVDFAPTPDLRTRMPIGGSVAPRPMSGGGSFAPSLYSPDAYSSDIPLRQFSMPASDFSVSDMPPQRRDTPFQVPARPLPPDLYSPDAYYQQVGPRTPDYSFPVPPLRGSPGVWNPDRLGYIPVPQAIPVPSLSGSLEGYPAYFAR